MPLVLSGRGGRLLFWISPVSHLRATMFLLELSFVVFLLGIFQIPSVERHEARFARATKQMVQTGHLFDTGTGRAITIAVYRPKAPQ